MLDVVHPWHECPCCSEPTKPTVTWTWFSSAMVSLPAAPPGQHGLLWVGEAFYRSPEAFVREAAEQGVSRRVPALPRGFRLGETRVYLAHRKAARDAEGAPSPGIFGWYLPETVDLVVPSLGAAPPRARRIAERVGSGARLVQVVRDVDVLLAATEPDGPVRLES